MAVQQFDFTTGPTTLPDVGTCEYNGCLFGPWFVSEIDGKITEDAARRTTRYMEYNLMLDGFVTLKDGEVDIHPAMTELREKLTEHAGELIYKGRGFDLIVNTPDGGVQDVSWGPAPELLEFQPLGGGRSAKVVWRCVVRIPEHRGKDALAGFGLLQFNSQTTVTYSEDYFSQMSIQGVIEIPLTRRRQTDRTVRTTVDEFRNQLDQRIFAGVDLSRFRVVSRDYPVSRDKRLMEFNVQLEEKPYMDLPPSCTIARGTYSVRPSRAGMGMISWMCTLRANYVVAKNMPRRTAWQSYLLLLRLRMMSWTDVQVPRINGGARRQNPALGGAVRAGIGFINRNVPGAAQAWTIGQLIGTWVAQHRAVQQARQQRPERRAWLMNFAFDEGVYLDSKTISFSASWRLIMPFSHILIGSGLWRKVPEQDQARNNLWAASVRGISGSNSWLRNRVDSDADIIVDMGS